MKVLGHSFRGPRGSQKPTMLLAGLECLPLVLGALAYILCGCGGGSSSAFSATTYTISGTITPASAGAGATVTLSGSSTASTSADSSGNYSFSGLSNGSYAVTPSRTGYSFNPTVQAVIINGGNATGINFSASQQVSYSVGISWQGSASAAGYNLYRSTTDGGPYSIINNSGLITGMSYTDYAVSSGNTYYYVATAVNSAGDESAYSNQASAEIP